MPSGLITHPPHAERRSLLGRSAVAIIAFLALILAAVPALQAHAADAPPAGAYGGPSTAYNGAAVSFSISDAGVLSGFETTSYCSDGFSLLPVAWTGMPPTQIESGQPFEIEWTYDTGDVSPYYELTGVVNADGTASGTGRAGFLPFGTCGGSTFSWTATIGGDGGDPGPGPGPEPSEPQVTVDPSELSHIELEIIGAAIEAVGLHPDADATLNITRMRDNRLLRQFDLRTDAEGEAFFYYRDDLPTTHNGEDYLIEVSTTVGDETLSAQTQMLLDKYADVYLRITSHDDAAVSPESLTLDELATSGITVSSGNYPANVESELFIDGRVVGEYVSDESGGVSITYATDALAPGEHEAMIVGSVDEGGRNVHRHVVIATFTVTENGPVYDPQASVSPGMVTVSELASSGVTVSGSGFPADAPVTLSVAGAEVSTLSSDAAGAVSFPFVSDSLGEGSHEIVLASGEWSASSSFTVTADPVRYDPQASVSPSALTVSELAASGVTVSGSGFPADAPVTLSVAGAEVSTASADAVGAVSFPFVSDSLGEGSHAVVLASGEWSASSSFSVSAVPVN